MRGFTVTKIVQIKLGQHKKGHQNHMLQKKLKFYSVKRKNEAKKKNVKTEFRVSSF